MQLQGYILYTHYVIAYVFKNMTNTRIELNVYINKILEKSEWMLWATLYVSNQDFLNLKCYVSKYYQVLVISYGKYIYYKMYLYFEIFAMFINLWLKCK